MAKAAKAKAKKNAGRVERSRPARGTARYAPALFCAFLVLLTAIIYSPSLNGPFLLDDFDMTEPGSAVRTGNLDAIRSSGRPLLMFTFRWNYLAHAFEPAGYHAVNIALHALNGLLVFGFLSALFGRGRLNDLVRPELQPLIRYGVPLLYVTTPVHTESVAYISSRSELFASMFYFAGLWLFVSRVAERSRWLMAIGVLGLLGCAVLSKQDKITLPAALLLIDYLVLARGDWRKLRANWQLYGMLAAGAVAGAIYILPKILYAPSAGFNLDWQQYLFTQFRMYPMYVRLLLAPVGLNADYDITPSNSLSEQLSWLGLLFTVASIAGLLWTARKRPVIAFGGLLFFLALGPTTSFYPLLDFAAERRLYIPALGFFVATLVAIVRNATVARSTLALGLAAVALIYSVLTYQRSQVWADSLALWQDTAAKSPNKERPLTWLGLEYNSRGQLPQAIEAWQRAEKVVEKGSQEHSHLLSNLGLAHANLKQYDRALSYYRQAAELSPAVAQFRVYQAVALMRLGRESEAWETFDEAYRMDRLAPEIYRLRGQELYQKRRYVEAERDFRAALEIRPEDAVAQENLALAQEMIRRNGLSSWPGPLPTHTAVYDDWVAAQKEAGTLPR